MNYPTPHTIGFLIIIFLVGMEHELDFANLYNTPIAGKLM